jgi:hypothetical protein
MNELSVWDDERVICNEELRDKLREATSPCLENAEPVFE